ncbi:hypothetical protein F4801DRAFT_461004 [Xylaria longipes]|nr:hypothetical protein F4801DRAFT_461004 [Xylaria longipes]
MSKKIVATTVVHSAGSSWSELCTSDIKYETGTPVTVKDSLYITFIIPKNSDIELRLDPWHNGVSYAVESEEATDATDTVHKATAEIQFPSPYTFNSSDKLIWGINNADLTGDVSKYTSSFKFLVEGIPTGSVAVKVDPVPHPALSGAKQTVCLRKGGIEHTLLVAPGQTKSHKLVIGKYAASVDELATADKAIVVPATIAPTVFTVGAGKMTELKVSYQKRDATLHITVGQLPPALTDEQLKVTVTVDGQTPLVFRKSSNGEISVPPVPAPATFTIDAELTVNNIKYASWQKKGSVSSAKVDVAIGELLSSPVNESKFVELPITTTADAAHMGKSTMVRLAATDKRAVVYIKEVRFANGPTQLGLLVEPGEYTVDASTFTQDRSQYTAHVAKFVVNANGSPKLDLQFTPVPPVPHPQAHRH